VAAGWVRDEASIDLISGTVYDVIVTILLFVKLVPIARTVNMSATLRSLFREGALYAALMSAVNAANTALLASNLLNNALLVSVSFVLQAYVVSRL
jgi:hypothetical protein